MGIIPMLLSLMISHPAMGLLHGPRDLFASPLTLTLRHGLACIVEVTCMGYSVGSVAKLAHVTVRTLHHYDRLGLLHPSERLASGYRNYSADDLERLQRILCYRQLGFTIGQIKAILDDQDPFEHLRRQHALLNERIHGLQHMVATVEKMMEARKMGISLEPHEFLDAFGESDPTEYHEEAEQRWGETDSWKESQRRVATYTKDDWKRIRAEYATLMTELAATRAAGQAAASIPAMDIAERHRLYIDRWFYPCSHTIHRGLGDMYVSDPRFSVKMAAFAPDLATYFRDAIFANAERFAKPL
jgi:MerR family transcriptional regulator, thiopeptide resistance regulator